MDNKLGEAINKAILAHNLDCIQEAQDDKNAYIELVDTSMRALIKEEVNSYLPQILPQAISDFATLVIEKNVTESVEATVLTRSLSQPTYTYEAAASLSEFELTKILIDKIGLETIVTKIKTPSLDQTEGRKEGNQVKMLCPPEIQGQRKRSLQAPLKTPPNLNISLLVSLPMQRSQVILLMTPACNKIRSLSWVTMMNNPLTRRLPKSTSSRNPSDLQLLILIGVRDDKLISDLLRHGLVKLRMLKNLPLHLMSSMILHLISLHLCTYKSNTELEYHLEEYSKATTERLDRHNPKNKPYLIDLRKPLSLIQDHRGRQIIPKDYFINKDLEYLKGGDLTRHYSTLVTKSKAATYERKWIEDLVPELWSPVHLNNDQHAFFDTSHWGPKRQSFTDMQVT
ncbi:hypothetical protein Tco_1228169 [Tanacetum coccineum]